MPVAAMAVWQTIQQAVRPWCGYIMPARFVLLPPRLLIRTTLPLLQSC